MREEMNEALALLDSPEEQDLSTGAQKHTRVKVLPADGLYNCEYAGFDTFAYGGNKEEDLPADKLGIKLFLQVSDGEQEGLMMERTFYHDEQDIARLFDTVTVITGTTPVNRKQALELLTDREGQGIRCKVSSGIRKKGKNAGTKWQSVDVVQG